MKKIKAWLLMITICVLNCSLQAQVSFTNSSSLSVGSEPASIVTTDINGDGKLDLIVANQLSNTISVLTNNGNGGFANYGTYSVGNSPRYLVAADLNGDGKIDIITANQPF